MLRKLILATLLLIPRFLHAQCDSRMVVFDPSQTGAASTDVVTRAALNTGVFGVATTATSPFLAVSNPGTLLTFNSTQSKTMGGSLPTLCINPYTPGAASLSMQLSLTDVATVNDRYANLGSTARFAFQWFYTTWPKTTPNQNMDTFDIFGASSGGTSQDFNNVPFQSGNSTIRVGIETSNSNPTPGQGGCPHTSVVGYNTLQTNTWYGLMVEYGKLHTYQHKIRVVDTNFNVIQSVPSGTDRWPCGSDGNGTNQAVPSNIRIGHFSVFGVNGAFIHAFGPLLTCNDDTCYDDYDIKGFYPNTLQTKLAVTAQPASSYHTGDAASITIAVQFASGQTATAATDTISVAISGCTASLSGTTSGTPASGSITFTPTVTAASNTSGCVLTATATNLTSAVSNSFSVDVDTTAPVPGNSGTITTASVTATTMDLNWTKATDAVTPQNQLVYQVYKSLLNNINSVANAEANGTVIQSYTADINTFAVSGLTASTTFYFTVLVKDLAGNKAAYTTVSQATNANPLGVGGVGKGGLRH